MWFFRPRQASAETLQCIWQMPPLVVSWFAIVPKFWRPFADHARRGRGRNSWLELSTGSTRLFGGPTFTHPLKLSTAKLVQAVATQLIAVDPLLPRPRLTRTHRLSLNP